MPPTAGGEGMTGNRPPGSPHRPHRTLENATTHNQTPSFPARRSCAARSRRQGQARCAGRPPVEPGHPPLTGVCPHPARERQQTGHKQSDIRGCTSPPLQGWPPGRCVWRLSRWMQVPPVRGKCTEPREAPTREGRVVHIWSTTSRR